MYISAVSINSDFNNYAIEKMQQRMNSGKKVVVKLEKEQDNPYDKKAIRVVCGNRSVGYVSASYDYIKQGTVGRDVVYSQLERYDNFNAIYSAELITIEKIDMKGKEGWRLILRKRNKADSFIDYLEGAKDFASNYNNATEVEVLANLLIKSMEEISNEINSKFIESTEQFAK